MAHFARIDENGIVQEVIVISNENAPDPAPENSEPAGRQFIESLGLEGTWIQTSYNKSFRKNFAGLGYKYDVEADIFIMPKLHEGWELDENYDWIPPIPMPPTPESGGHWYWDDETLNWVLKEF